MWILTRLLRLFPKAFREQFGEDMAEQVGEDWRRARARGGLCVGGKQVLLGLRVHSVME